MDSCESEGCHAPRLHLAAVMLMAGQGQRLGGRCKALLSVAGEALAIKLVRALSDAGLEHIVAVTGHYRSEVEEMLAGQKITCVAQQGDTHSQADSLRLGVSSLPHGFDAVMVLPVDMPCLTRDDLVALIGTYKHAPAGIEFVGPVVDGRPGNPVLFSARIADRILAGEGAFGSGAWRNQSAPWLLNWETDNPHYVIDIDLPEDLTRWCD